MMALQQRRGGQRVAIGISSESVLGVSKTITCISAIESTISTVLFFEALGSWKGP